MKNKILHFRGLEAIYISVDIDLKAKQNYVHFQCIWTVTLKTDLNSSSSLLRFVKNTNFIILLETVNKFDCIIENLDKVF